MTARPGKSDRATASAAGQPRALEAPATPTTLGEQLDWATRVLGALGAAEPAREAAVLLASAMGLPSLPAEQAGADELAASEVDAFLAAIARRSRDVPPM